MSEYVLKNISSNAIRQTKTNTELYKVQVPIPSYLKGRYRNCKYGNILIYQSCITEAEEPFCKNVRLTRDSYSIDIYSRGTHLYEDVSAEDIFQEYQVYAESTRLIITDADLDEKEEICLHDVPAWLIYKEKESDDYRLLLSIPERLLKETHDLDEFTEGNIVFHKEQIKNVRGGQNNVTDILLPFTSYSFSIRGDDKRMYSITRQEVIDTYEQDQKRRQNRKSDYQKQMEEMVEQYKGKDFLEIRHLFKKNLQIMDDTRCTVTLPVPASVKNRASKWFCTLILPTEHVIPEPPVEGNQLITARLYAPEYEISYPVTDTNLYNSGRHTRWEKSVVTSQELYDAHQHTLSTFDFYIKNGLT